MTERQISRMADLEFLTDLVRVIKTGIRTANPSALDALYRDNDVTFPDRLDIEEKITFGLGEIINLSDIHRTRLTTRENTYSLFAALLAIEFPNLPVAMEVEEHLRNHPFADRADILTNLSALADALESEEEGPYNEFVNASRRGTNTEKNRRTRFQWFHRALISERL
jgi:hypothetical protein